MGRSESGVRAISESSIEIAFSYRGVRCRERVRLKPTPANLKRAARHRAAVLDAIERNTFDYAKTFPDSARRLHFSTAQAKRWRSVRISVERFKWASIRVSQPLYGWKYERKETVKRQDDIDPFSSDEQTAILPSAG